MLHPHAVGGLAFAMALFFLSAPLAAQDAPAAQNAEQDQALQWPRAFDVQGAQVIVYQPQIDEWIDHKQLNGRAAVEIIENGKPHYGSIDLAADTKANLEERQVLLDNLRITKVTILDENASDAARYESTVRSITPKRTSLVLSLEQILAALDRTKQQMNETNVSIDPPPIFYSSQPAVLVMFLGEPRFEPVGGSRLNFCANTNWDLFMDASSMTYYLLIQDSWVSSKDLSGPWTAAASLPGSLNNLPDDEDWAEVKSRIPGTPATSIPKVIISKKPAELIVTEGNPDLEVIPGTSLFYIKNSEQDVFYDGGGGAYYFLTAGRWFKAPTLQGDWQAATRDLPADFAKIPADHPRGDVLASVPGTPEADAAVLLANVPQKATVKRSEATIEVKYEGDPRFQAIDQTTVSYAINTPMDVLRVNNSYYCCYQGVWFVSGAAAGPWAVADTIPAAIYTIPPTCPKYNVTYVHIYDSTPDEVVVGYTSGYTGQYIAFGLVMFGLGYAIADNWDDDDWHYRHYCYNASYFSYGTACRYDYYHGGYYRAGGAAYGPYGGAGRWGAYDPWTGTYARGAAAYGPYGGATRWSAYNPWTGGYARGGSRTGPRGTAFAREGHNPYTDTYAARAGASTPYGSWGRSVATDGDDWVQTGHRSGARGTVVGGETSEGGAVVGGVNRWGNSGFAGVSEDGDAYVGRNGEVYKRNENGTWKQYDNGDWNRVDPPKVDTTSRNRSSPALSATSERARSTSSAPGAAPSAAGGVRTEPRCVGFQGLILYKGAENESDNIGDNDAPDPRRFDRLRQSRRDRRTGGRRYRRTCGAGDRRRYRSDADRNRGRHRRRLHHRQRDG